jgi:hypothetical protein
MSLLSAALDHSPKYQMELDEPPISTRWNRIHFKLILSAVLIAFFGALLLYLGLYANADRAYQPMSTQIETNQLNVITESDIELNESLYEQPLIETRPLNLTRQATALFEPPSNDGVDQAPALFEPPSNDVVGQAPASFEPPSNDGVGQAPAFFEQPSNDGVGQASAFFEQPSNDGVGQTDAPYSSNPTGPIDANDLTNLSVEHDQQEETTEASENQEDSFVADLTIVEQLNDEFDCDPLATRSSAECSTLGCNWKEADSEYYQHTQSEL